MRIEWLPEAVQNYDDQIGYIELRNPVAALRQGDMIDAAVARLARFPAMGRTGRVEGTRELPISGTRYVVVYRLEKEAILILRVLHGAQEWPPDDPD